MWREKMNKDAKKKKYLIQPWMLKQRRSLLLEQKVKLSQRRIRTFYEALRGKVYVAFSGGKDSTVLLDVVRHVYPNVPGVFIDTGLEYPEIRQLVKTVENVTWIRPKLSFKRVIEKYGYPVVSKEQACFIREYRTTKSDYLRKIRWEGKGERHSFKISEKWKFLVKAPFKISERCCDKLKKDPVKRYEKETGKRPYLGLLASDSVGREVYYLHNGCNILNSKKKRSSPIMFWREEDIWDYIKSRGLKYASIYDKGASRTGCIFCMFGVHLEKEPNRFQRLKETHPKLYDYCINKLGIGQVLDYIDVPY
jgi:3'-phosphoadenosine 5'-phosphosulfate sulfotransferase (PAPS reductase)/FAD synthetase